jgi:hypothetical protein
VIKKGIAKLFIRKAFFRVWLADKFLYRKDSDKHEFSRLLSPTFRELGYLIENKEVHRRFQLYLIKIRRKIGHH